MLAANGAMAGAALRNAIGVQKASTILRDNVYGWFDKVSRGTYALSDSGRDALGQYADVLAARTAISAAGSFPEPDSNVESAVKSKLLTANVTNLNPGPNEPALGPAG